MSFVAPEQADGSLVLALHSSSAVLGVGLAQGQVGQGQVGETIAASRLSRAFPLDRALSNHLFTAVEEVCPADQWPRITRLAVAIGPGGFTGTRLTVVMARTLAQQLGVPLDGVCSGLLIARRLQIQEPTWLVQDLPRRGVVAGCYGPDVSAWGGVIELEAARLYGSGLDLPPGPQLPAQPELPGDVDQLLDMACLAAAEGRPGPWQPVLPIYPTSPVHPTSSVAQQ
ncbi:tRNA (adenosine(37)-N6)-threonylcarbamoyltransferase complex dimerization subunit type 1 TsaB [Cyanobium sp. HWJ4-Hawea]|uniref:tRNA (adenosine(37)-N6)-threonylcarbamoyltransferase complex dimerization subunit type 1 TsaB n=1 Tax=Cyanobium sp. HWJ4-Hawea TaxID=2823713 RepID=UPI0020CC915B|nr:tRNA (adenosine(37)-N6)-threonylcarbamoyltransferase complex dimerization subunit type 1 TsaB [Cyanobium sp. HWJ4-Hawea]MCP9810070.1 tRNA (adenosine(37)-N6)-threonylcarbamoyltransferase complex dimerization subunit type 1 TsaB [Cyanobium sp. HWJ4-Hawea]